MIAQNDILCSARVALISSITQFDETYNGTVNTDAVWTDLHVVRSGRTAVTINSTENSTHGRSTTVSGSLVLKSDFTVRSKFILELTFGSGNSYIIGRPDEEITWSCTNDKDRFLFSFTWNSAQKPLLSA